MVWTRAALVSSVAVVGQESGCPFSGTGWTFQRALYRQLLSFRPLEQPWPCCKRLSSVLSSIRSADDISRIREEAKLAVARSGAVHETIEVHVEVDRARGILRATAVGAHEFLTDNKTLPVEQLRTRAGELLQVESDEVDFIAQTERFTLFAADVTTKMLFGLFEKTESSWAVLDSRGRARLTAVDGGVRLIKKGRFVEDFEKAMEEYATFGDAGMSLPDTFLITDTRIVDLSGLMEIGQRLALCSEELANTAPDALVLLAVKRR